MQPSYSGLDPLDRMARNSRGRTNPFLSASTNILHNSSSTNNFLFNAIMAQSLTESDLRQERRKDALLKSLELQDKLLSGFGPRPKDNPIDTKIVTIAKMLEREKREREKRERRERQRLKLMMDQMI